MSQYEEIPDTAGLLLLPFSLIETSCHSFSLTTFTVALDSTLNGKFDIDESNSLLLNSISVKILVST